MSQEKGEWCPKCDHYTLQKSEVIDKGKTQVWRCTRCGYRTTGKLPEKKYFIKVQLVSKIAGTEKPIRGFETRCPARVSGVLTDGGYIAAITWYEKLEKVMKRDR